MKFITWKSSVSYGTGNLTLTIEKLSQTFSKIFTNSCGLIDICWISNFSKLSESIIVSVSLTNPAPVVYLIPEISIWLKQSYFSIKLHNIDVRA